MKRIYLLLCGLLGLAILTPGSSSAQYVGLGEPIRDGGQWDTAPDAGFYEVRTVRTCREIPVTDRWCKQAFSLYYTYGFSAPATECRSIDAGTTTECHDAIQCRHVRHLGLQNEYRWGECP